ncbi:ORF3 [Artemisia annua]|uniref:ORF3 n=1 Tax=Artemisia annua TaxID=35608 RepID=A0A2U1LRK0_ARTAN|nr:ORF3 [Artemisia annua]
MENVAKHVQYQLQQKISQLSSLRKKLAILEKEERELFDSLQSLKEPTHIPYDVCSCKECLDEASALGDEPLNKAKCSNKPRRSKQKSWKNWSTLGEPSGKWDYYVKYDPPANTIPIEEISATGWGDEFPDDKGITEKILDNESSDAEKKMKTKYKSSIMSQELLKTPVQCNNAK